MRHLALIITAIIMMAGVARADQAAIVVPNGTGAQVRTNLNAALNAISTQQSGTSAPSSPVKYQLFMDTSTTPATWKVRNGANSAWITIGTVSDSAVKYIAADSDKLDGYHASTTPGAGIIPVGDGSGRIAWAAKPAARGALVYNGHNNGTAVEFSSESYDTDNIHSTTTNKTRLTVPSGVTKVRLTAQGGKYSASINTVSMEIMKNGSSSYIGHGKTLVIDYLLSVTFVLNISTPILSVTAGDYFELSGPDDDADGSLCWFAMEVIE